MVHNTLYCIVSTPFYSSMIPTDRAAMYGTVSLVAGPSILARFNHSCICSASSSLPKSVHAFTDTHALAHAHAQSYPTKYLRTARRLGLGEARLFLGDQDEIIVLGFETVPNVFMRKVRKGEYIRSQWEQARGLSIRASGIDGGFTPNMTARVFDTADPLPVPGMGSPNDKCNPAGPGIGAGGQPGMEGENCVPQGKALIIQDDADTEVVRPYPGGGYINFYFEQPVTVVSVGLLDINDSNSAVHVYKADGTRVPLKVPRLGRNSFQNFMINVMDVTKIHVFLKGTGAVTDLVFDDATRAPSVSLGPSGLPSLIPTGLASSVPSNTPSGPGETGMPSLVPSTSSPSDTVPSETPSTDSPSTSSPSTDFPSTGSPSTGSPSSTPTVGATVRSGPGIGGMPTPFGGIGQLNYVTKETATEIVTIPDVPVPADNVNVPRDCPFDDGDLWDWHNPATWVNQGLPASGARIDLPINTRVVIRRTVEEQLALVTIPPSSELIFADSPDQERIGFSADGINVLGKLTIGTETCRIQNTQIAITLHGTRLNNVVTEPQPISRKGIAIQDGAVLSLYGKRYFKTWTRLAATVRPGDTVMLLQDMVNWEPGQQVVLVTTAMKDSREYHQNEVLTIQNVSVTRAGDNVFSNVAVEEPIQHTHVGVRDYQAEVGLLSRKIIIQGAEDDSEPTDPDPLNCRSITQDWYFDPSMPCPGTELTGYGGHIMILEGGRANIAGVELYRMGQTNVLGRYPIHFNQVGEGCVGCSVSDSSIHRSFYRCISIHGTNGLLLTENVAFDVVGHCYYLEDGMEQFSILSFNLAAHIHMIAAGSGADPPSANGDTLQSVVQTDQLTQPADVAAAGFFITNVQNNLIGNVAVGGWAGFVFPTLPVPVGASRGQQFRPMNARSLLIEGNSAHSTAWWWDRGGAFYFGGSLRFLSDVSDLLVYNPGRDPSILRDTCVVDKCAVENNCFVACPENEHAWISVTNTKVFLTPGAGLQSWSGRLQVTHFEAHDMGLSLEAFQDGIWIDDMLAVCRSGREIAMPTRASLGEVRGYGLYWYGTDQEHIVTNTVFRKCGARTAVFDEYNNDPTRGCGPDECEADSFVFGFRASSNQHNPELMQATRNITFDNCGRRFSLHQGGTPFGTTTSSRIQNWFDVDGSVTGIGRKSLIVSGVTSTGRWWNADQDAVFDPQGPLYFLEQVNNRGLGHMKVFFDAPLQNLLDTTVCRDGGLICPLVGHISHRGTYFDSDRGLPVAANGDIVGLTGGFGWELRLDEGAPRTLRIEQMEIASDSPLLLSVTYPLGTAVSMRAVTVSCRATGGFVCVEIFDEVDSVAAVYNSSGNKYHHDRATGVVTFRVITIAKNFVGMPEWILPTYETLDRNGVEFAIPRFERVGILLPKANDGPYLEITAGCTTSPANPTYCLERPPQSTPVNFCPTGYVQVGFDRCCVGTDPTNCLFASTIFGRQQ